MRRAINISEGQIAFATYPWWKALKNAFGWTYGDVVFIGSRIILVILAAGVMAISIKLAKRLGRRLTALNHEQFHPRMVFPISLVFILGLGLLVSPFEVLGGGRHDYDCHGNVIASYETAADHISQYIEEDDRIYWKGDSTQVL